MTGSDRKADLHRYLQAARDAVLWKLNGLSDYDIRRPMVPAGTNLSGLMKHMTGVELGYFGDTFRRPFAESLPWLADDAEPNADMWATADESRQHIVSLYHRACSHDMRPLAIDVPDQTSGGTALRPASLSGFSITRMTVMRPPR